MSYPFQQRYVPSTCVDQQSPGVQVPASTIARLGEEEDVKSLSNPPVECGNSSVNSPISPSPHQVASGVTLSPLMAQQAAARAQMQVIALWLAQQRAYNPISARIMHAGWMQQNLLAYRRDIMQPQLFVASNCYGSQRIEMMQQREKSRNNTCLSNRIDTSGLAAACYPSHVLKPEALQVDCDELLRPFPLNGNSSQTGTNVKLKPERTSARVPSSSNSSPLIRPKENPPKDPVVRIKRTNQPICLKPPTPDKKEVDTAETLMHLKMQKNLRPSAKVTKITSALQLQLDSLTSIISSMSEDVSSKPLSSDDDFQGELKRLRTTYQKGVDNLARLRESVKLHFGLSVWDLQRQFEEQRKKITQPFLSSKPVAENEVNSRKPKKKRKTLESEVENRLRKKRSQAAKVDAPPAKKRKMFAP